MAVPVTRSAHLIALSSFALAQPLFDLLGRNPEFFAAHGATPTEILAYGVALVLVPPAALLAAELVAGLIDRGVAGALHLVFVAALCGLVALEAISRLDTADAVLLAVAAALGGAAAWAYAVFRPIRSLLTLLAAAPALFLGLFVLGSPAGALVTEGGAPIDLARIPPARAPVVLLVFDELPLNSLLDERGRIDAVRFPHFARLARGADWFPNATTVHEGTVGAVPAILTGRIPRPGDLPRFDDHRRNLFTLLGGGYRLEVFEAGTSLCPPDLCRERARGVAGGLWALAEDSGLVYLHIALPEDLARGLPPVTERWAGFLGADADEPRRVARFLASFEGPRGPALHYGHFLLPHSPWHYLPNGQDYRLRPPGRLWSPDEVWSEDAATVVQSLQRHLLQAAYVDALLGRMVARLRATGLYDRALVVVVADHGISFRPGGKRRPVSAANLEDIAFVPLLVKRPHQRRGRVLERHVETVDLLPTITDVLGVAAGWPLHGRSAYAASPASNRVVVRKDRGDRVTMLLSKAIAERDAALGRQLQLFGSGTPAVALYGIGRYRGLLGRAAPPRPPMRGRIEIDFVQRPGGGILALAGRVPPGVADVAFVVRGRVAAVVPVLGARFCALVPAGDEGVRVLSVTGPPAAPRFETLAEAA